MRDGPPLSNAASLGPQEIVQALLNVHGIDVNSVDNKGRSALSYAACWGHEETVQALLAVDSIDIHFGRQ